MRGAPSAAREAEKTPVAVTSSEMSWPCASEDLQQLPAGPAWATPALRGWFEKAYHGLNLLAYA